VLDVQPNHLLSKTSISSTSCCPSHLSTSQTLELTIKMPNRPLIRLLFAQGKKCFFCKEPLPIAEASVEHLVAKANGGSDHDGNCVACCKSLNTLLGSMSLKEKIDVILNQKGQFQCPNGNQKKVTKNKLPASPKATKSGADYCTQVVENLKQRGRAKPRTVAKLKTTIAALFRSKKLSPSQVDDLVQQLQTRRVISVAESKVTYNGAGTSSLPAELKSSPNILKS